ncbi:MAG: DNA translocase FtsK 4TM domain-containing protein [Pacificimonas sp.]
MIEVGARTARRGLGVLIALIGVAMALALVSYDPGDPSLNRATTALPENWMSGPGALFADMALQLFGLGAALALPLVVMTGIRLAREATRPRLGRRILYTFIAVLAAGFAFGILPISGLPAGPGGLIGLVGAWVASWLSGLLPPTVAPSAVGYAIAAIAFVKALIFFLMGLALPKGLFAAAFSRADAKEAEIAPRPKTTKAKLAAKADTPAPASPKRPVRIAEKKAKPSKRAAKERQSGLRLGDEAQLPPLSLLSEPPVDSGEKVDEAALEQNARLLETVLDDFGVKGEIVEVRPGPVVTMYELEPAPGIKSSRVIGLADDIARSMSAVSARVAVVPGRNVIGIELPNKTREMVVLSELLTDPAFERAKGTLPIVLGKDIAGLPTVTDLAPMPHLLIAGTTGSGKSVGLNAMILSLLYRMKPEQCRMIMIDPKMLELSVYDGIPHLLSPVVTEPQKAIRALKWAVEQMEERYRMMASVNVRSLAAFNDKVTEAKASGKPFERRVHTGYDPDSGQPIYETESLEYEPLPLVVIIVDELADLMMTAGKEVEFLIQRLAQKARAAGLHLIMATQRPSVDVITGVIKANLPTRISFSVTSKIDSRTIIGEQGAEQLLGKGDMLFMNGGKFLTRVHGPFVSDEEVERVADHWREQGSPDYVESVTEEPDPELDQFGLPMVDEDDDPDAALFRRAVEAVASSQKASTSHVQRQLRIGYNNAARLIDQMEEQGLISAADHVGRREVLIDQTGNRI